jgi:hypothetical protein
MIVGRQNEGQLARPAPLVTNAEPDVRREPLISHLASRNDISTMIFDWKVI